jgi:hydroxypyruvate reductase
LTGDTTDAARRFGATLRELAQMRRRLCLLAGGETTVRVRGSGRGGRNQEFALALADAVANAPVAVLSVGTDGVDGPTDAAGAFVDGTTQQRARARGLDADAALADNDSYTFFAHLGDLFRCGPTGTNVMDLKMALVAA